MTPGSESGAMAPHANIGPRGCRRRGRMGWVWLAIGAAIVVVLVSRDAPLGWYAITAPPFLMAMLGHFQARAQTCVFFAAIDRRDMDGGAERITDPSLLSVVRVQARGVWMRSILGAVALTGAAVAIGAFAG